MISEEQGEFIGRYGSLVTAVWSDIGVQQILHREPKELLSRYTIPLPVATKVSVVEVAEPVETVLDRQLAAWHEAYTSGEFTLYIPFPQDTDPAGLEEEELDAIVAGAPPGVWTESPSL